MWESVIGSFGATGLTAKKVFLMLLFRRFHAKQTASIVPMPTITTNMTTAVVVVSAFKSASDAARVSIESSPFRDTTI